MIDSTVGHQRFPICAFAGRPLPNFNPYRQCNLMDFASSSYIRGYMRLHPGVYSVDRMKTAIRFYKEK